MVASRPYSWVRDIRLPEQVQGLPELLLGRFGRHGSKPELSGHECGGGVVEAYGGSGVVGDGAPYGMDGAVDGKAGVEAPAGGGQDYGGGFGFYRDYFGVFGCGL